MKADKVFLANSPAVSCVDRWTVEARAVNKGDSIIINVGFNVMTTAEEKGWQVIKNGDHSFMNDADFNSKYEAVTVAATQELPAGSKVTSVKKGERILVFPFGPGLGVQAKAEADGMVVELPNDVPKYWSAAEFAATFNNAAIPPATEQGMYQAKPTTFVVLSEDTVLDFEAGPYQAKAGDFLCKNDLDVDGYTLCTPHEFHVLYRITDLSVPKTAKASKLKK